MPDIVEMSRASALPGGEVRFTVCRPRESRCTGVIYLLHGLFGAPSNWLELTRLTSYLAQAPGLAAVLVDGRDAWYSDGPAGMFESSFFDEVVPAVGALFGTEVPRAVAGLSMGGYGALKFTFRRPSMFRFAASMSGAFEAPEIDPDAPPAGREDLADSIRTAFGGPGSDVRRANDLFQMETPELLPELYLDCGTRDVFLDCNRRLHALLDARGIAHRYEEPDVGHDWDYWDARLAIIVERAHAALGRP